MRKVFPGLLFIPESPGAASWRDQVSRLSEGVRPEGKPEEALDAKARDGRVPAVREVC